MGGSESKTVVNQLSQVISDISMKSVLDCQVTADQTQNAVVNNTGWVLFGTYKLEQATDIKSSCFSDTKRQAQFQNDVINAIKQASTASGSSIMPAFGSTSSSSETNLTSIIKNTLTTSTLQKNYNAIKQNQNVTFNNAGIVGYQQVQLTQGAQIFAASTLKALDDAGVFNTIKSHVDQTSDASNSLFSFGSLFSGLGSYAYIFIFAIVLYLAYTLYMRSGVGKKTAKSKPKAPAVEPSAA